jgi:hypothetical protein
VWGKSVAKNREKLKEKVKKLLLEIDELNAAEDKRLEMMHWMVGQRSHERTGS